MTNSKAMILLIITTLIWGLSFVAQSAGMDFVEPSTFNTVRFLLGGLSLIPLVAYKSAKRKNLTKDKKETCNLLIGGFLCGLILALASGAQQIGIQYTTVGKAGFLTSLYIIIVPILSLFLGKKVSKTVWISLPFAFIGTLLLCGTENFQFQKGDLLCILCAFLFSIHIMLIGYYSPKVSGIKLSCLQFLVASLFSSIAMFIFETPKISNITAGWVPIVYAGVFSCGIAYTLQIIAQKSVEPSIASIILSLESVFALIFGWIILKQHLKPLELLGCLLVFGAVLLAQRNNSSH